MSDNFPLNLKSGFDKPGQLASAGPLQSQAVALKMELGFVLLSASSSLSGRGRSTGEEQGSAGCDVSIVPAKGQVGAKETVRT